MNPEQWFKLQKLTAHKGFGVLMIASRPGDVIVAVSPVPEMTGFEIVAATNNDTYDIWKDGELQFTNLTEDETIAFVHERTPEWLYDQSTVTDKQKQLITRWIEDLCKRYASPRRPAKRSRADHRIN